MTRAWHRVRMVRTPNRREIPMAAKKKPQRRNTEKNTNRKKGTAQQFEDELKKQQSSSGKGNGSKGSGSKPATKGKPSKPATKGKGSTGSSSKTKGSGGGTKGSGSKGATGPQGGAKGKGTKGAKGSGSKPATKGKRAADVAVSKSKGSSTRKTENAKQAAKEMTEQASEKKKPSARRIANAVRKLENKRRLELFTELHGHAPPKTATISKVASAIGQKLHGEELPEDVASHLASRRSNGSGGNGGASRQFPSVIREMITREEGATPEEIREEAKRREVPLSRTANDKPMRRFIRNLPYQVEEVDGRFFAKPE